MLPLLGVYEVAVRVRDLKRAEAFYCDLLDLEVVIRDETRNWLFLRVGQAGMVVLQEDKGGWPTQHFAFTVSEDEIARAADLLRQKGLRVDGPILHNSMPLKSVYFEDPDGHSLELCAPVAG